MKDDDEKNGARVLRTFQEFIDIQDSDILGSKIASSPPLDDHMRWCELKTGLWHRCDCGFDAQFDEP